ncbi:hypothetical protein OAD22_01845 [Pseudomonadales bacterium]|nr:hypothetical protein [Pseudomonadales bacterium]MDB9868670.1 hypothetical protein [Pseudomonadales bacterium]MDB9916497.1 hypothetical protein [Pseudomonadales bacterium]MDC1308227.1 hypothetical protein [Pseudomonadales bacterium]MDC1368636.1 hypothetical protein [Pseudomonadales bacterium]
MTKPFILLSFMLLVPLAGCSNDTWEGFVYPSKSDLSVHKNIGTYPTLEACRAAAHDVLDSLGAATSGDFECGLNCEYQSSMGSIKVCDETRR